MGEFRACQRNRASDRHSFPQQSETVSVVLLMPTQRENDERGARIRECDCDQNEYDDEETRCSFLESSKILNRRFI